MGHSVKRTGFMFKKNHIGLSKIVEYLNISYAFAVRDFKQRYQESRLGLIWVVIQPLTFLIVIATVMHFGLRKVSDSEIPYLAFLAAGYIPWLFFSSSCTQCTIVFAKYSYVVKNIKVPPFLLLLSVFLSNIFVHIILLAVLMIMLCFYGYFPKLIYLQLIYYFISASVLVYSIVLVTSAIYVFFRDIQKVIAIMLQFCFWVTPILWDKNNLSAKMSWAVDFNPVNYIVSGYRDTILHHVPFYESVLQASYFWSITCIILLLGLLLYKRLSPHFIELL